MFRLAKVTCFSPSTTGRLLSVASSITAAEKEDLVQRLLQAKDAASLSFDDLAEALGVTNAFAAQLMHGQAQLKPDTEPRFRQALPLVSDADVGLLKRAPTRSWDPAMLQEPHVYRMNEAVLHYGRSLKAIVNEKFGDGIMSAIDFYVTVDKVVGTSGEPRVVIKFNGKYLPHVEQLSANDTSRQ